MVIDCGGVRLTFRSEHRRLKACIQALAAAGLLTETIREVKPPAQDPAAQNLLASGTCKNAWLQRDSPAGRS